MEDYDTFGIPANFQYFQIGLTQSLCRHINKCSKYWVAFILLS